MNYQDGYSQKALDALAKGKYKSYRSSGLANSRYTEGKKKRDNAVVKQNKTQNPTPRNTNAMANDPRFFAPSVSLPVPTLPMVNAMQGDPRFQVQPEYNGDEVLNQLLGGVKSPVKESPNLSDMIPGNDKKVKSPKKEQKQTDKVAEIMGSFDPTTPVKVTKSDEDKKKRARAIQYQQNLADREQSYKYNPIAKGANTLDDKDLKFMDDVFENFGDEFAVQTLANSDKTKDWEQKYGKSFEQIYADYLADRRNRLIEQGEESPVSNWLYTVADKTLRTPIAAAGDFVSKVVSPDTAMSKRADAIRHQVEDDIKLRRAGIKENTGDFGDKVLDTVTPVADRMVASNVDKLFGLGGVFTGLSDYSNQMEELNMRPDMTEREKALDAGQHGLVEGLGTAITMGILDKIPSVNGLWGNLLNVGKGAGNAAFENTISEIVEMGLDSLIAGDNSQKELNKQIYMLQGMDEKQAEDAATMDQVKQAGTAAGTGALFGGTTTALTQAAKGIANAVPDLKTRLTNAVVDKAKSKKVEANDAARLARAEIEAEAQANINRVPDVVEQARAQAERAQAEIEILNEQLPKQPNPEVVQSLQENLDDVNQRIENLENTRTAVVANGGDPSNIDTELNRLNNRKAEIMTGFERQGVEPEEAKAPEAERSFSDMSPEEQAALQADLDNEYSFDQPTNEVAANDTGIESNPTITERYPFPEKADGSRPDYHNVEEVSTRLETTRQSIAKNNEDIEALNKQLNDIPDLKKNAKERSALKNQIYQLEQQNKQSAKLEKILTKISEGKKVSNKDIFEVEFPDDYHAIFDGRGGFFGRVNMATKFAGDTPEAKALAQSIRDDIYAIAKGDFDPENLGSLLEKVYNLDRMAKETKADYRARGTGKNPSRVYKYDDFFAGTKNGIGDDFTSHVIHSLDKAYQIANNMTDIDTTSRVAEAAGESAPIETPESVAAELNQTPVEATNDTGIDNRVPTAEQTPVETNQVPAVENPTEEAELPTANDTPPNRPPIKLEQNENGDVVETGTSKHIRADGTPMKYDVDEAVVDDFVKDPAMYRQLKNEDTKALSEAVYNSGDTPVEINGKTYEGNPEAKFRQLLAEKNPAALYLGSKIAKDYSAQGNHKMAAQIYRDMSYSLKDAGQFTQASAIAMMKNDPLTALAYFEKQIDDLNKEGKAKYGKKWKKFELTDEERALFDGIENGDEKAIKEAYDKIGARIEKEYPSAWWEKVLEFRRVAMLLNTRTIMRNTFANPPTAVMRYLADRIEGVGQWVAHLINPDFEVTQAKAGSNRETRKLATEVYKSDRVQRLLKETPGRLSEVPKVGDYAKSKQIFKGGFVSNFINKMTGNGIEKLNAKLGAKNAKSVLELARNSAYSALEITDSPFVRENFVSRLGSYMKAKGIKNVDQVSDEAINIALEEALKATYKDNSWLVQAIRKLKGGIEDIGNGVLPGSRAGDFASQALIPYVQAPGNIGARIVDYSAVGGAKGLVKLIRGANKGDMKLVSKGIEEMSKGASGTVMAAIGMALYKSGLITGTSSTDPDQKEFEKEHGFREFAFRFNLGGKTRYATFDWAQPWADTIMSGVLLAQAIENSDQYDSDILRYFGVEDSKIGNALGALRAAAGKEVNYFFDATPLKNLGDLLQGGYGQDKDIAKNIKENMVDDFITGLLPAQGNALAKTIDPTQRITYDPSNEFSSFVNSLKSRVPGLTKTLPTKYGTWGQPMTHGDSKFEAGLAKMLIPGELTSDNSDWVDKEINKIYEDSKDSRVFPHAAPNSIDSVKLTAEEKSEHQKMMGEQSREFVEAFLQSDIYNKMSANDKADTLNSIYELAKNVADYEIKGKKLTQKASERYDQYKQGDLQGVLNSIIADNNPYGVSGAEYTKAIDEGTDLSGLEGYKAALKDNGLTNSKANQEIYKKGGEQALVSSAEQASQLGVESQEYSYIKGYAGNSWSKVEPELPKLKDMGAPYYSQYAHAYNYANNSTNAQKLKDSGINFNMKWFADQAKRLDVDKSNNVSQDELINFFNQNNMSQEEVMAWWGMFALGQDGKETQTLPHILKRGENKGKWGK